MSFRLEAERKRLKRRKQIKSKAYFGILWNIELINLTNKICSESDGQSYKVQNEETMLKVTVRQIEQSRSGPLRSQALLSRSERAKTQRSFSFPSAMLCAKQDFTACLQMAE